MGGCFGGTGRGKKLVQGSITSRQGPGTELKLPRRNSTERVGQFPKQNVLVPVVPLPVPLGDEQVSGGVEGGAQQHGPGNRAKVQRICPQLSVEGMY